jgi:putative transposase
LRRRHISITSAFGSCYEISEKIFTEKHQDELRKIFYDVCKELEAELIEFNGEQDHVHLLVSYPPGLSVSKLVGRLKGVSGYRIRQIFKSMQVKVSIGKSL